MSKFIIFIDQGIKHFFIIDGEYLGVAASSSSSPQVVNDSAAATTSSAKPAKLKNYFIVI